MLSHLARETCGDGALRDLLIDHVRKIERVH